MDVPADSFRLLVESVQDYAIYLLGTDGVIHSWNAGAQRLKGYSAAEIVGQHFSRFFSPEDASAGKPIRLLERALSEGRVEDIGWRFRKDGSQFWASAVITTLRDASGTHLGFAKVTRDLTDRAYRAFIEASHAIVWSLAPDGRPNADSPTWRAFTGQTEDDWRNGRAWAPIHPDDAMHVGAVRANARVATTPYEVELRLRRADGVYVWVRARTVPLLEPDGRIREWFGTATDISAQKQAQLDVERALELWRTTLRSIGDAVISTDAEGRVRFLNPISERLTGWSSADAIGRPLAEVFPIFNEGTHAVVENPVEKVLRDGAIVGLANHTVLRSRNGREIPIDDSAAPIFDPDGKIDGVVLVFRDVSEEKRESLRRTFLATATQRLVEAVDYPAALAEVAQLAVPRLADWVAVEIADVPGTPTKQVAVAHVDPSKVEFALELSRKYPPDRNAPTGVPNVIRTGKSEFYSSIPKQLLEAGAQDAEHLRIIRELDLRSAMVVPLRGRAQIFGAITFVYAQSERRYTEADLAFAEELADRAALIIERRRLEEEAEHANRMKDEFLATMSHELRTPLQAILGYAAMLKSGHTQDTKKALDVIERNAVAQARLVEDILDVSRISSGKLRLALTRVDIATAVRAALDAVRPAAQARRIVLVENFGPDLGTIHGDFERLQQIIWNLVSNAVKFSEPTGIVNISAHRVGSEVSIKVRDTGNGIPREHLSSIFERFRQLDSSTTRHRGGLGLGLAIVRYLVEAHGGTVAADSEGAGTGATFTVTLPTHVEAIAPQNTTFEQHAFFRVLHGLRIILVDDDDDAREVIADVLRVAGATVTTAPSAADGFAALEREPPHVLISDIGMPGEDGYSLLARVRALPPERGGDVPAIALTAFARPEDFQRALAAGFQLHIAKPVMPDALLSAVRMWARSGDR